jgi:hypothetical protein
MQVQDRKAQLVELYSLLDHLCVKTGAPASLTEWSNNRAKPIRGVYFLFETGEQRSDTGSGLRVVRVGTHALKERAKSTLGGRLRQHRGQLRSGGGNHRGSIFRLLTGKALMESGAAVHCTSWGVGSTADRTVRAGEIELEKAVSRYLCTMRVVVLPISDPPGPNSLRGVVERGAIALLSNYAKPSLDPPSANWLGRYCPSERVRQSGLWNQNHVDEVPNPVFLHILEELVQKTVDA